MAKTSRRDFLKATGVSVAGAALGGTASSYGRILGANDRVGVGIVGFSDRTRSSLIPSFAKVAGPLNFELVAVSDIWNRRREEGAAYIAKLTGKQVAVARNNDELYDRKDVQAVIIATADFQHAFHGVEAVRAGRDAYVEKPMAHSVEETRVMTKVAKETGLVTQMGNNGHAGEGLRLTREWIQAGAIGAVREASPDVQLHHARRVAGPTGREHVDVVEDPGEHRDHLDYGEQLDDRANLRHKHP